jgi:hypothetical protein
MHWIFLQKTKKNVNKIHQISLENNLIRHKIKEMQDSLKVQPRYLTKYIGN